MKPTIPFLMLLVILPSVIGIMAGTQDIVQHFDICDSLDVTVAGELEIIPGEYLFLGCNETQSNNWTCPCFNGYDLKIETLPITVNTYNITMQYQSRIETIETSIGGHRLGGGVSPYVTLNENQTMRFLLYLGKTFKFKFAWSSEIHTFTLAALDNGSIIVTVVSTPINVTIGKNDTKGVVLDDGTLEIGHDGIEFGKILTYLTAFKTGNQLNQFDIIDIIRAFYAGSTKYSAFDIIDLIREMYDQQLTSK